MDSLSFPFLLFASYCLALVFVLPYAQIGERQGWVFDPSIRNSWPVVGLTVVLFTFSDIVIDPVALQGERWFLGRIYGYPQEGIYFGVPLANFVGWAVVGFLSLFLYRMLDVGSHATTHISPIIVKRELLMGVGLYYSVLVFNLAVTFWIGEIFMGLVGCFIFLPLTAVLLVVVRGAGRPAQPLGPC